MIWDSWDAFWAMGGYGLYVWGSYAVVLMCIAGAYYYYRKQVND